MDIKAIKKQARFAGFLYVLASAVSLYGLIFLPPGLIVLGNASATAEHIRNSMALRIGIMAEVFMATLFVFTVLALYQLFKEFGKNYAVAMVVLILVSMPIVFLDVLNDIAALMLVTRPDFLSVFDIKQAEALAYLFIRLHGYIMSVAFVFWGLWLLPFGVLVIRSRFIPRILGFLLIIACFGYLANGIVPLYFPQYVEATFRYALAVQAGELPIILWLVFFGAREQRARLPTSR